MFARRLATYSVTVAVFFVFLTGCSFFTTPPAVRPALSTTTCKPASVAQANQAGIALYNARRFDAAKLKFTEAIVNGPTCAEAHYNLGLSLSYLGAKDEAHDHFIQAADLAPGNQIIWDSPALRPYGDPQKEKKSTKAATEQAPGAFSNRARVGGGY